MSKELVERLRKGPVAYQSESGPVYAGPTGDSAEAADLIERQSTVITDIVAAFDEHESQKTGGSYNKLLTTIEFTRAALTKGE